MRPSKTALFFRNALFKSFVSLSLCRKVLLLCAVKAFFHRKTHLFEIACCCRKAKMSAVCLRGSRIMNVDFFWTQEGHTALETALEKVLRRVLSRCLAMGFRERKGSEKGSQMGVLLKGFGEGT